MLRLAIRVSCLGALCALLAATPALSQKDKKDKKVDRTPGKELKEGDNRKDRARWEWKVGDQHGTFQGHKDGKVTYGKKMSDKWHQIGSWKTLAPTELTVTFTEGPLKGKADLKKVPAKDPKSKLPAFEGQLVRAGGKKETLYVELLDD